MSDTGSGSGNSNSSGGGDSSSGSRWDSGPAGSPSPWERPGQSGSSGSASDWPGYPSSQTSAPDPFPSAPAYGQQQSAGQGAEVNPYATPAYGSNPYAGPYGTPYGGYALPNHPSATTAMVLGIVGIVTAISPIGIPGFFMGGRARREIDANPTMYGGRGMATAGWVLGIICIVFTVVWVVLITLGIIGIVAASRMG